jgi:hypothetical protein
VPDDGSTEIALED